MVYCQDCGASNNPVTTDCRICGRQIKREKSTTPCTNCEALLGEGALFCSACGKPVPVLTGAMARESSTLQLAIAGNGREESQPASPQRGRYESGEGADSAQSASTGGSRDEADMFDTSSLVSEDDLPSWLRQAIQVEEAEAVTRKREDEARAAAEAEEERRAADQQATERERAARETVEARAKAGASETPPGGKATLETGHIPDEHSRDGAPPADLEAETTVVAEPRAKRLRRRGKAKVVEDVTPAVKKERLVQQRTPRSYPWEGHGDKVVLVVSLILILVAILLLAPGLLG